MKVNGRDSKSTNAELEKSTKPAPEDQPAIVLAYKVDPVDGTRTLCSVHETDFQSDPTLVRFRQDDGGKTHISATVDAQKSKSKTPKASRRVAKVIRQKRLADTMKTITRDYKISKESNQVLKDAEGELGIINSFFLAQADKDLRAERLWKERADEVPFAEAFPESAARARGVSKRVHSEGTFLDDSDITTDDRLADAFEGVSPIDFPRLSAASFYELMRPPPDSLEHQVARKLADRGFSHKDDLAAAIILLSRGVDNPEHFIDALIGGLYQQFPNYYFHDYYLDRILLKPLIEKQLRNFFDGNRAVRRDASRNGANIWGRFRKAWKNLTAKQRHALEKLYWNENPQTFEEAANDFGISVTSLQSRVEGAFRRFRQELPELAHLRPKRRKGSLRSDITLNGMWRISSAKTVHPLKSYDLATGRQIEISPSRSKPRRKNLTPGEIAEIKTLVYETTPIPNILDSEYFCGLRPDTTAREPEESGDQD